MTTPQGIAEIDLPHLREMLLEFPFAPAEAADLDTLFLQVRKVMASAWDRLKQEQPDVAPLGLRRYLDARWRTRKGLRPWPLDPSVPLSQEARAITDDEFGTLPDTAFEPEA